MNRLYIIIPVLLLALFGGFYWNYSQYADQKAAAEKAKVELAAMEEAALKEAAERKAREDAEKRRQEREAAEKSKEEERRAVWEADNRKVAEDTVRYSEQAEKNRAEVERLEAELKTLRDTLATTKTGTFSVYGEIEKQKGRRWAAELEYERMLSMATAKLKEALLAPASGVENAQ